MSAFITPLNLLILIIAAAIALVLSSRLAKDPSFGLSLIAFFLPFERIPSLDFAGFTFKINHLVGGLTFVFWLLAVLFQKRKIAPNPLTVPLLLFFFGFLISGIGAVDSFRHLTVFISLLIMLVLYITTVNTLTSKQILQRVVGFILLAAALMSIIGIYQFFADLAGIPPELTGLDPGYTKIVFGFPRVHAFSKEPLYFANYLFIPLGIGLALFFSNQSDQDKQSSLMDKLRGPWLLPLIVLMFINFLLTLSRGAFIAFVPFALIFCFFYGRRIFTFRNVTLGLLALVISVTAVYKTLDSLGGDALDRFLGHAQLEDVLVSKQGESGFGRLQAFTQAIDAWQTSPVVGIGLGNFGPHIKYYPVDKPDTGWDIVNNEYLELLAETGVVGLGLFLIMVIILFFRSIHAIFTTKDEYLKAILVGLTAAMVAMLTQYNFFSTLYIIHIWVMFGLMAGVQNLALRPKDLP